MERAALSGLLALQAARQTLPAQVLRRRSPRKG
jgi:hypothetical protein